MHLWRKMRRVWVSVSVRIKPTLKSGKDGETYNGANGLLKLQDDVMMCGYEDVQVMWNLLNSPEIKQISAAGAGTTVSQSSSSKCSSRQWLGSWMAIFWPNHHRKNTCSSSSFCSVKSS